MPARNAGPFLSEAVASVLAQEGAGFELVVVDDGSHDDTARVAAAVGDPRVRLLRNPVRRGIGYCHNRVLAESASPIVIHVDADDVILPGALSAMAAAVRDAPEVGQAFCDFESVDLAGRVDVAEREVLQAFRATRTDGNHRRDLVLYGMVVNTLRTYRRAALDAVGPFDETLPYAVDYEMALRLADRFVFRRVPRLLYRRRIHGGNVGAALRFRALRFWWMRARICRRLGASGRAAFLQERPLRTALLLGAGLVDALGLTRLRPAPAPLRTP